MSSAPLRVSVAFSPSTAQAAALRGVPGSRAAARGGPSALSSLCISASESPAVFLIQRRWIQGQPGSLVS